MRRYSSVLWGLGIIPIFAGGSTCNTTLPTGVSTSAGDNTQWTAATIDNSAGPRPVVVAVADLDGDTRLDVVAGYQGTTTVNPSVSLFLQSATGTFTATQIAGDTNLAGIVALDVADIDGDGPIDVVCACDGRIVYLHSPATPTDAAGWALFTVAQSSGDGFGQWNDIAVTDVDAAGRPDLVACNGNVGRLSFFAAPENAASGDGWIRRDIDAMTRTGAAGLAVDDVDGDGRNDCYSTAPGESTNRIAWYQNPGADSTAAWTKHGVGNLPATRIALGDLDRDSDTDVVVIDPVDTRVAWYVRPADLTTTWSGFVLANFLTMRPIDIAVVDVNGNNESNVVVATQRLRQGVRPIPAGSGTTSDTESEATRGGVLRWFSPFSDTTEQWLENNLIDLFDTPGRIAVGILNSDSRPDIVAPLTAIDPANDQVAWFQNATQTPAP
ncbi:MAG: FG-GAP repeat domain-containing protein [Phycisphaerae bacterium]